MKKYLVVFCDKDDALLKSRVSLEAIFKHMDRFWLGYEEFVSLEDNPVIQCLDHYENGSEDDEDPDEYLSRAEPKNLYFAYSLEARDVNDLNWVLGDMANSLENPYEAGDYYVSFEIVDKALSNDMVENTIKVA